MKTKSLIITNLITILLLLISLFWVWKFYQKSKIGAEGIQTGIIGTWSSLNYWENPEKSKKELQTTYILLLDIERQFMY